MHNVFCMAPYPPTPLPPTFVIPDPGQTPEGQPQRVSAHGGDGAEDSSEGWGRRPSDTASCPPVGPARSLGHCDYRTSTHTTHNPAPAWRSRCCFMLLHTAASKTHSCLREANRRQEFPALRFSSFIYSRLSAADRSSISPVSMWINAYLKVNSPGLHFRTYHLTEKSTEFPD